MSAQELYSCNNLTRVPGETYNDSAVRVLKIENKDKQFFSLEPCCGTHAKNTKELEDICVTAVKRVERDTFKFHAVCGPLSIQVTSLYH